MTGFFVEKFTVFQIKKKFLFLITLFTMIMLFILSNKCQDSVTLIGRDKKNIKLQHTSTISVKNVLINATVMNFNNLKHILEWNWYWSRMIDVEQQGQGIFVKAKCKYTNCYITDHRDYLGDYTKFDAILFGPTVKELNNRDLPQIRSPHQKYIFSSWESSTYFPVCSDRFDGYFNWTWTFRLDSDIFLGYIVIRDANGTIIGPKAEMHWLQPEDMDPVPQDVREKLKIKTKFAAWIVSNCFSRDSREILVTKLSETLKKKGNKYQIDVYGTCGDKICPPHIYCEHMVEQNYYFYLAFENSYNPDYVTEKILRGLEFNTIPVVYGGANYTRFMPDGSYLNAKELGVEKLADKMIEIVNDFEKFVEFFKWKKYYTFTSRSKLPDSNHYCTFCALLNNEREMQKITVKRDFQKWWDPSDAKC